MTGIAWLILWGEGEPSPGYGLIIAMLGAALLGLLDDLMGTSGVKGLKGHLTSWLGGNLTTGALKALGGGSLALFVARLQLHRVTERGMLFLADWMVSAGMIALAMNLLNLADLRPGRAGKVFLLLSLIALGLVPGERFVWLLPVLFSALVYLPGDLQGRFMMGDTGSNVLGIAVGTVLAWWIPWHWKLVITLSLVALHLAAERVSFSKVIAQNSVLRRIDGWGRQDN